MRFGISRGYSIVDRNKPVARLVPPSIEEDVFADMRQFRESLSVKGESLSQTVIRARQEERYNNALDRDRYTNKTIRTRLIKKTLHESSLQILISYRF